MFICTYVELLRYGTWPCREQHQVRHDGQNKKNPAEKAVETPKSGECRFQISDEGGLVTVSVIGPLLEDHLVSKKVNQVVGFVHEVLELFLGISSHRDIVWLNDFVLHLLDLPSRFTLEDNLGHLEVSDRKVIVS